MASSLRRRLRSDYPAGGKLPSEPDLARQFDVSRSTIRQALAILEREGIVTRRHGSGTYVNKYVLQIQTRAEVAHEFSELIALAGFKASIQTIAIDHLPIERTIADKLDIEAGQPGLFVRKLFLADGKPALYCIDVLPESLINTAYEEEELNAPIFDFLLRRCGETIKHILADIIPTVTDDEMAARLNMASCEPLLRFDEVMYNDRNQPVLFSRIFYKDDLIRFSILRKKV